jgi:hypothetical protein
VMNFVTSYKYSLRFLLNNIRAYNLKAKTCYLSVGVSGCQLSKLFIVTLCETPRIKGYMVIQHKKVIACMVNGGPCIPW